MASMPNRPMSILVTGAGGFLGTALTARLLSAWPAADHRFTLVDRSFSSVPVDARVVAITDDIDDSAAIDRALKSADVVFHLAAIPGGAAERNYAASKRVNLDLTLGLIDRLASRGSAARVVYASSIAVFGMPLPTAISDDTCPHPSMTYGAHKLMVEVALTNLARLGLVDALALRLPGIVCRPGGSSGLKSAFLSELFHAAVVHRDFVIPTRPQATVWIMSASCAVDSLIHGAVLGAPGPAMPRAFTLPSLRVTMEQLVAEVVRQTQCPLDLISYQPDHVLEMQFGRLPPLSTAFADELGFVHDGSLEALVSRALAGIGVERA